MTHDIPMVERVAAAIADQARRDLRRGYDLDPIQYALVAIEAARIPDAHMVAAANDEADVCWSVPSGQSSGPDDVWRIMIDRALEGK